MESLPAELTDHVMGYLDAKSLLRLRMTSKDYRDFYYSARVREEQDRMIRMDHRRWVINRIIDNHLNELFVEKFRLEGGDTNLFIIWGILKEYRKIVLPENTIDTIFKCSPRRRDVTVHHHEWGHRFSITEAFRDRVTPEDIELYYGLDDDRNRVPTFWMYSWGDLEHAYTVPIRELMKRILEE
jgi:hypothetical protein